MTKKTSSYRGMMQKLEGTVGLYAQRDIRDYALREVSLYARKGTLTDVEKLQRKYNLSGLDAQRLHRSVKRRLLKLRRDAEKAAGIENKRKPRRATSRHTVTEAVVLEPVPPTLLVEALEAIRELAGEELFVKGEQVGLAEGFVYLLTHEMHRGWVKAGMTIDYEMRLAVYNTGDPLCRYEFRAMRPVPQRRQAETDLLLRLASKADEQRGEWFRITLEEALKVFGASWL